MAHWQRESVPYLGGLPRRLEYAECSQALIHVVPALLAPALVLSPK
jgi:hypothetical protein